VVAYRVYVSTSHWGFGGVVVGRNTHVQWGELHGTAQRSKDEVVMTSIEEPVRTAAAAEAAVLQILCVEEGNTGASLLPQ
jgi:hypothetical protein